MFFTGVEVQHHRKYIPTMGFPSDLLRLEAEVQLFRQCAALVKALMKRRRVLFITMFMSVCLQPGLIQSCPRDEERKRRRLLRLLLGGKRRQRSMPDPSPRSRSRRSRAGLLLVVLLLLLLPHTSYPPPTPPPSAPPSQPGWMRVLLCVRCLRSLTG